ncbi:MAG TPA: UDP-N-acetylmuramoyl-L-alanine--D-glutamate ligase [Actinomycetota bacterium]|nr:UDP-N-acetylmuramoyl-L-alanine--D-glutamate ligase [Actinomycetota bacterium]
MLPGSGDRVLVGGLGISGLAAAAALIELGATVIVTDDGAGAEVPGAARAVFGGMDPALIEDTDLLVVAPGVPPRAPLTAAARDAGVPVWSEIELGYRMTDSPVIGVTGTNGKTTTTEMIAAALAGDGAIAAGNIGTTLTEVALQGAGVIVCELSSFQLEHVVSFRPRIAVLLNIAEDHIDWHGSFDAYAAAKARIFANQTAGDTAIVHDDPACLPLAAGPMRVVPFAATRLPEGGAGVEDGIVVASERLRFPVSSLQVEGTGMIADAVAAAAAADAFGADPAAVARALAAFLPARHRTAIVATIGGVVYVNDSKATNPHATLAALEGRSGVVLIAGGRNKGMDLSVLARASGLAGVVAIGESAGEVEAAFADSSIPVARAASMREAVGRATAMAPAGGTVILSPACASFDWYGGYAERGDDFERIVLATAESGATGVTIGESEDAKGDA